MLRPILLAATLLLGPAAFGSAPALQPGEELTFRADYKILSPGQIKVAAREAAPEGGRPRLGILTTIETTGFVSNFYKLSVRGDSIFDAETGRLLRIEQASKDPRKQTNQTLTFDYAKSVVHVENRIEPAKSGDVPMPPGEPLDLIMALVQTRSWDIKPGEKRDMLVIFDDDFYELTIHAEKYEDINVGGRRTRTLVLVPKMEKTPPKGMFKRGSTVKVWISQDERRLPVRFQTEMNIGPVTATLISYKAPPAAKAAAGTSTK